MKPGITAPRELYIDRLRTVLTAIVIVFHGAITYGADGGWFWYEHKADGSPVSVALTMFVATNQAYFMGFFFLLAGYFTPGSLERKGYRRFLLDRLLRLGVPLLFFIVLLGPLTVGIAEVGNGGHFWEAIGWLFRHHRIINGPLWFAEALLLFSAFYAAWRARERRPLTNARAEPAEVPRFRWWMLTALATGFAAWAIRLVVPTGQEVIGLQLGYFASYVFLFGVGVAARRYDSLRRLGWAQVRPAVVVSVLAWPLLPGGLVAAVKYAGRFGKPYFSGGWGWEPALYAFWEPLVAWGLIGGWLLYARAYLNGPSRVWDWLGRRAYAVYILHPPVLVGLAVLLHGWAAPALVKVLVVGPLACVATWLISDVFVRMPGVRQIV